MLERFNHELHPVYGAIPRDGETVERGDVLGLSVDEKEVIIAPISGQVRLLIREGKPLRHLFIEIQSRQEQ